MRYINDASPGEANVLWVSRHDMTPEQQADLERGLGCPARITKLSKTITDVREIVQAVMASQATVCAVVLPIHLMGELLDIMPEDIPVLMSKSARRVKIVNGIEVPEYVHLGWTRYREVHIVKEPW